MEICLDIERPGDPTVSPLRYRFAREEVLLGRAEAVDVRLSDPAVSLVHLRLLWEKDHWVVVDGGSANGTLLGGRRLISGQAVALAIGARLRVGPFVVRRVAPEVSLAREGAKEGLAPQATADLARAMVRETFSAIDDELPLLEVLDGPLQGDRLRLEADESSLGRGEQCTFALPDGDASRRHAIFRRDEIGVEVIDLGSKNGVLIGDVPIVEARRLVHGDEVKIGHTRLRFHDPAEAALAALREPFVEDEAGIQAGVTAEDVAEDVAEDISGPDEFPIVVRHREDPRQTVSSMRQTRGELLALVFLGTVLAAAAAAAIWYLIG
ncbi:MAG: FHA domain-containing protein [Deltaproteobacteria bacterium]|nr:FHA domain-containing protein [Deltaproteobacteria bacterium]